MNYNLKKLVTCVGFTTVGLFVSTSLYAQNNDTYVSSNLSTPKKAKEVVTEAFPVPGKITNVGNEPSNLKPIKGFANDLPVVEVLKQITPSGWVVKQDNSTTKFNTNQHISWKGGQSWNNVLSDICSNYNINATVNWDKRTITVSESVNTSNSRNSIFQLEGSSPQIVAQPKEVEKIVVKEKVIDKSDKKTKLEETVIVDNSKGDVVIEEKIVEKTVKTKEGQIKQEELIKATVALEAKPVNTQQVYKLVGTKTLKDNVAIWASKAGYRLVWSGEDYPVVDSQITAGLFDNDDGPIQALSVDYGLDSRVQMPLSFTFYKNKTLVVENVNYEQSGHPQYSKK